MNDNAAEPPPSSRPRSHQFSKGDGGSMKKTVLTFGPISGAISAGMMPRFLRRQIGFDKGEIISYTTIVISALLVFFGIRSYRENLPGGRLTFGRRFAVRS